MASSKTYSIQNDTPNQKVKPDNLHKEIQEEPVLANITSVNSSGDALTIIFDDELTQEQTDALDDKVAEHTAHGVDVKFHESTTLFSEKKDLLDVNSWEDLGGVVTDPLFFTNNISSVVGRVSCAVKTDGAGAEIRVTQEKDGVVKLLTDPIVALPDTNEEWAPFQFSTTVAPDGGGAIYRVEGRRAGSTSAEVKYVVISMMEVRNY